MVILDSDHSEKNVLDELRTYRKLVAKGSYIPVKKNFETGPMEVIIKFLKENNNLIID